MSRPRAYLSISKPDKILPYQVPPSIPHCLIFYIIYTENKAVVSESECTTVFGNVYSRESHLICRQDQGRTGQDRATRNVTADLLHSTRQLMPASFYLTA